MLTLRKIERNPGFTAGAQVKVTRSAVAMTRLLTDAAGRNDWMLRRLFAQAARGLPLARLPKLRRPRPAPIERRRTPANRSMRCAAPTGTPDREPHRSRSRRSLPGDRNPDARGDIVSHTLTKTVVDPPLDRAIAEARDALIARQSAEGYWLFELEADCTIPAEYIMMMHFLDEIDRGARGEDLPPICAPHQAQHGGWPLYHGGDFNISCIVKAYYALKLAGDDPRRAAHGRGRAPRSWSAAARRVPMCSRALRWPCSGNCRGAACPTFPSKSCCCRDGSPFHLDKVAYWSRTVMVPLFILCTRKPVAKNPRNVHIRELFTTPPEKERDYFRTPSAGGFRRPRCSWRPIGSAGA